MVGWCQEAGSTGIRFAVVICRALVEGVRVGLASAVRWCGGGVGDGCRRVAGSAEAELEQPMSSDRSARFKQWFTDHPTLGPVLTCGAAALFFSLWFLEMTLSVRYTIIAFFAGWLFSTVHFFYLRSRRRASHG